MTAHAVRIVRRTPPPEHLDLLFGALIVSFLLHVIAMTALYIQSNLDVVPPKREKPTPYMVHLVDPGPTVKQSRAVDKRTIKVKKEAPLEKTVVEPKKMVFIKDKVIKKLSKKKIIPMEVKKGAEVAKRTQERKTGGKIDIRKFPYEWYLQIMESRIYRNWDTLSINFFTDIPILVTVYFQITRSGALSDLKVEHSSANEEIDKSALKAVEQSVPFPPLPPGYKEEFLEVHFGFRIDPE